MVPVTHTRLSPRASDRFIPARKLTNGGKEPRISKGKFDVVSAIRRPRKGLHRHCDHDEGYAQDRDERKLGQPANISNQDQRQNEDDSAEKHHEPAISKEGVRKVVTQDRGNGVTHND